MRLVVRRRLDVARARLAQWQRSRDDIDVLGHELAIISSLIRLHHEKYVSLAQTGAAHCDVDALTVEVEQSERQSEELTEILGATERLVDPVVLGLGRYLAS